MIDAAARTLRAVLPSQAKAALRAGIRGYGTALGPIRSLPDFLIAGTQKGGTTALFAYLMQHPSIGGPARKEIRYFDRNAGRSITWYRGHFPTAFERALVRARTGVPQICGEASPGYLFHPLAPVRAARALPRARIVFLLRNPVDRALSHYVHECVNGRETETFEEALRLEPERLAPDLERMAADPEYLGETWWTKSYTARGDYAPQLRRWLDAFSPEQVLVLLSEELFADPGAVYARVLEFVGAPPHRLNGYPKVLARDYEPMAPETRARLVERFRAANVELASLLGRDPGWDR